MFAAPPTQSVFSVFTRTQAAKKVGHLLCGLSLAFSANTIAETNINNPLLDLPVTQIAQVYGDERVYDITRNGKQIGTHTLKFQRQDNEVVVDIDSTITVRILRVPVFRLQYLSTEIWRDDKLVSATATTIENGKSKKVALNTSDTRRPQFTTNHWNPGVLKSQSVFNTLSGKTNRVAVDNHGMEQLTTPSGVVSATHYVYGNNMNAEVWYDAEGLWLQLSFVADDGSNITYLRRS